MFNVEMVLHIVQVPMLVHNNWEFQSQNTKCVRKGKLYLHESITEHIFWLAHFSIKFVFSLKEFSLFLHDAFIDSYTIVQLNPTVNHL